MSVGVSEMKRKYARPRIRKLYLKTSLLRLGYAVMEAPRKFRVNPKIPGDVVHIGGRAYRKGEVYDPAAEKLPARRLRRMLKLKINGLQFFVPVSGGGTADPGETPCKLNDMKDASKTFAEDVLVVPENVLGLVSYSTKVKSFLDLTDNITAIEEEIDT